MANNSIIIEILRLSLWRKISVRSSAAAIKNLSIVAGQVFCFDERYEFALEGFLSLN